MTSKLDPQELERLSKAATQGLDHAAIYAEAKTRMLSDMTGQDFDFHHLQVVAEHVMRTALRTGQLVPAQPSDVDLVAEAECMKQMRETAQEIGYSDVLDALEALADIKAAMPSGDVVEAVARKFNLGDRVTKTKGSSWTGLVVGFYSTSLTPVGYAVESENEPGSVQIYPESALAALGEKP